MAHRLPSDLAFNTSACTYACGGMHARARLSVMDGDYNVVREESEFELPDYINPN